MRGLRGLVGRARRRPSVRALALLLTAALVLVLAGASVLGGALFGLGAPSRAAAAASEEEAMPETDASVPARAVTMIGATPEEAGAPGSDETWGLGREGGSPVLVRYASGSGWTPGPALPAGFKPEESLLAGQMTRTGSGVLAGSVPDAEAGVRQVLLVRSAGGAFAETGAPLGPAAEPLLGSGETLYGTNRAPLIAPLDEAGGAAGALLAPVAGGSGVEHQVLHWDGKRWTAEPIAIPANSQSDFRVLAIGADSPHNAWLLGQLSASYPTGSVALFRRVEEAGGYSWKPVALSAGAGDGEAHPLTVPLESGGTAPLTVPAIGEPPTTRTQLLTVTPEGVWIDGARGDVHTRTPLMATIFYKPEGAAGGHVDAGWCAPQNAVAPCQRPLPENLPSANTRSIAWGGGGPFGERVITGLGGGVSLRLAGESFKRVLALGAGGDAEEDPGAQFGAAFSSPTEGWLGEVSIPVHLTTRRAGSRLTRWPTPFRHPLLAIAPQPGAAVGSLSSEALAVGDLGAVARYKPGQGWIPESLFGPGQRVETPRLRAVAWPTPNRAFAVGDSGQMWLWRGETGLWERDPATPLNFRENLLGVAFDPTNPTRGYAIGSSAVGSGGVVLRYGKTWTPETSLPAQVQHAAFIGIAFAGSEAIVAYREQPDPTKNHFVGGLMVNDGSGWRIDQEAATVMDGGVPDAVAGLADGGAGVATVSGPEGPRVYERESFGAPWKATPVPLPGVSTGSLALFREGGALRAVASGGGGVSNQAPATPAPPGFPPGLGTALAPQGGSEAGGLLRQTASGWSDETHELNPIGTPAGGYINQDLPYMPDAVAAVLIDPSGQAGWAVGGELTGEERTETGGAARYPADGVAPTGVSQAPVPVSPELATFAVGGHAECAAPCAERALAGVGPQTWLSSAVSLAGRIGVRAFLYTGPSVTQAAISGLRSVPIPFASELGMTASILSSGGSLPAYVAAAPADLNARPEREGSEEAFASAFAGFPQAQLAPGQRSPEQCAGTIGCQAAYYSFLSEGAGGTVRVIVLDDTGDVNSTQLSWLENQLAQAAGLGVPAIVTGSADLNAQVAAGDAQAENVIAALVRGNASAYFFDSVEQNVHEPLRSKQSGGVPVEAFGSGTLGYVNVRAERNSSFHGASGILLAQVGKLDTKTRRAPVTARLIPVIGELAMEAKDGLLLHRSASALFAGLARRPRAGAVSVANTTEPEIDPYIPIPSLCLGGGCATALEPEYTFSSSRPDIGNFVEPNTTSPSPHAVAQNANGEPIPDPQSGLFCAFNAGTTIVTISAGGLSASLPVTVQAGSVRQPCGTTRLKELPAPQTIPVAAPPPVQPAPGGAAPAGASPPVPLPAPPVPLTPALPAHQPAAVLPPFVPLATPPAPLLAFIPPPVPTPARPTPPSGTSAVTSPIEVAEKEEEQEEATESVSNQAVAYRVHEHEPVPEYLLGLVLLAALAGASITRRARRRPAHDTVAPATVSGARGQRQLSAQARRRR